MPRAPQLVVKPVAASVERVVDRLRERETFGARFSIVVVAEGAEPVGGGVTLAEAAAGTRRALGGVGAMVARRCRRRPARRRGSVVLGHLQRGGPRPPSTGCWRRVSGARPLNLLRGVFGRMVANNPPDIVPIPLADVVGKTKTVPLDYDLLATARALGVSR